MTDLDQALTLHGYGFQTLPAKIGGKNPGDVLGSWGDYQTERVTEDQVRDWFGGEERNVWIMTGPMSRIVVLDIDSPEAERVWRDVVGLGELMDRTPRVRTAHGMHYYFRLPNDIAFEEKGWAVHEGDLSFDVQAAGRGVVGPGSIHETGVVYEWVQAPDPDQPNHGLIPAPAQLRTRERFDQARSPGKVIKPTKPPTLAQLKANPASGGGRNIWLAKVCGHLARNRRTHGWDWDRYFAEVSKQADRTTPPMGEDEVLKTARSVWGSDERNHPEGEVEEKAEDKEPAAMGVIRHIHSLYEFYCTPEGEVFAVPVDGPRRPVMLGPSGSGLRAAVQVSLFDLGQVNGTPTIDTALSIVHAQAKTHPRVHELDLRMARTAEGLVLDLAERGTARCVVITADGWTVRDNPPEGVLFRLTRATRQLPAPSRDGDLGLLLRLLDWPAQDRRWALIQGWLAAACFPDIPRPLLLFNGQSGSAKTTRALLTLSVLEPRDEMGSSFGKNQDDEQIMAVGRYLVGWDNVTRASDEVSDRLCRVVTGDESLKRRLYTDDDQVIIAYRRTGAITAITIPNFRPDALQRLIPIQCDYVTNRTRTSESQIREAFERDHTRILGGLLDNLVMVLTNLRASQARDTDRPRMADFYDVLHALSPDIASAYFDSVQDVMVEAAESDPFVSAVVSWLGHEPLPLRVRVGDAWTSAERHVERSQTGLPPWWPASSSQFSKALMSAAEPLRSLGYEVVKDEVKSNQGRRVWFKRTNQDSLDLGGRDA